MTRAQAYKRLGTICSKLPEAANKPFGGHTTPAWRVRDKIFVGTFQEGRPSAYFKAAPGVQEMLVGSDPVSFFVPPYVGPKGWVGAWLDVDVDWKHLAELIQESFRLIAPKSLTKALDS